MAINCCHHCVAPKRYPGCHDHCPEYAEQSEKHKQEKEAAWKAKTIQQGLVSQRADGVYRANARKRR